MPFVCHSYINHMYSYVTRISFAWHSFVLLSHSYVTRMCSYFTCIYPYVIGMSFVYSWVIRMSLVYTRINLYIILVSFVCILMLSVRHSYILVCHSYVTRMWFYHELCLSFNANKIYANIVNPDVWNKCIWLIIDTRYRDNMNIVTFSCINFKPIQSNKPP